MQRVFNFSGGRTSAYMTLTEYKIGDIVLFCDTGREHEKTYEFIKEFEKNENIPIVKICYGSKFTGEWGLRTDGKMGFIFPDIDITTVFGLLLKKRRSIPNQFKRFCTLELKIKTARRYLRSKGIRAYENFIGFRGDENIRVLKRKQMWKSVVDRFPLNENNVSKQFVNQFWSKKSYRLILPAILGNCDLCPIYKGKKSAINILTSYPEIGDKWIKDEDESLERKDGKKSKGYTYFQGITLRQIRSLAESDLFANKEELENAQPVVSCGCFD